MSTSDDLSPLTAGGIENDPDSGSPSPGVQDEPLLDQNVATDTEKIDGIVAQTRSDVPHESTERISEILRQRFSDAEISVTDEEIEQLAQRVAGG